MEKVNELNLQKEKYTSFKERSTYALYFVGQNIIFNIILNYLMLYYTDYALIPLGAITVLTGFTKIWDAVNDPIFGTIVDNIRLKAGKFKPWILISSILLPAATLMLFAIPSNIGPGAKVAFAAVTYLIWDLVYTISDAPAHALSTVMTDNIEERNTIMMYNRVGSAVGVIIALVAMPILFDKLGPFKSVLPIVILSLLTMLPIAFTTKERFVVKQEKTDESGLKNMFRYLKNNKYLFIIYASVCIRGLFKINLNQYISIVIFGDLKIAAIFGLIDMIPMIIPLLLTATLLKKFNKIQIYRVSVILTIVLGFIFYLVGYNTNTGANLAIHMVMRFLIAIPEGFIGILVFTFSSDCIEYGHYVTGSRNEGITFSIQTFAVKLYSAGAIVITSLVLTIMNYTPNLEIYAKSFSKSLWFANFILPFVGSILSLPLLYKYLLTENDVQIMASINSGKITEKEGTPLLSKKYK